MKAKDEIKDWLERPSGKSSERNDKKYHLLNKIDEELKSYSPPAYDVESELIKLKESIAQQMEVKTTSWIRPLLRIAAIVVLVASAFLIIRQLDLTNSDQIALRVDPADKTAHALPDLSSVHVNAGSIIKYSSKAWDKNRALEFDGEAYFEVAKGSRFTVKTLDGQVEVLGTKFNIKNWEGYYEVTCYEGSVRVKTASSETILKPGDIFQKTGETEILRNDIQAIIPAWINGKSEFNSIPLKQVFDEFERQYDMEIIARGINLSQNFTGSFTHENRTLALKSITIPAHLDYKIDGRKIVMKPL